MMGPSHTIAHDIAAALELKPLSPEPFVRRDRLKEHGPVEGADERLCVVLEHLGEREAGRFSQQSSPYASGRRKGTRED